MRGRDEAPLGQSLFGVGAPAARPGERFERGSDVLGPWLPVPGEPITEDAVLLFVMAFLVESFVGIIVCIVVAGMILGVLNTVFTESAMEVSDLPRPVASGTYSGVRFIGGAVAPIVAGSVSESISAGAPYFFGAGVVVLAVIVIAIGWKAIRRVDGHIDESPVDEAYALTGGDA